MKKSMTNLRPKNHKKYWSENDFSRLVQLINSKELTIEQASKKLHRTVAAVQGKVDLLDLHSDCEKIRNKDKNWNSRNEFLHNIIEITDKIREGYSDTTIADLFGINIHTYKYLKRKYLGEYVNRRRNLKKSTNRVEKSTVKKVLELYHGDYSLTEISTKLKLKLYQINYILYGNTAKRIGELRRECYLELGL